MQAGEISKLTTRLSQGIRNGDEGYLFGAPDQEVTGVVLVWKPTLAAMRHAVAKGCNMMISHEFLYDFEYTSSYFQGAINWKANIARQNYLKSNSLIVYHWHGGMLSVQGVTEKYHQVFGLKPKRPNRKDLKIFCLEMMVGELQKPMTLAKLAKDIKARLKLKHVRMIGDPQRTIRKIAIGAGGDTLFTNASTMNTFLSLGAEAIVGGESDAYAANFVLDGGGALIDTDHPVTDNIAVQVCYEAVKRNLPGVPVEYFESPSPWRCF
ncbi:MAG: Nif3-like dinuclear metal center hexameric protein [Kiritimatiellaeota bacterium]|nr:Nif3-like dinuclear metal center hexameric protein [Kiritimatiellota bacterium]